MKPIATLLAISLFCGCSAFGKRSPISEEVLRSRQLSQQGVEAMHRQQWDNAEQRLSQAIKACPHDYQARSQYAEVMLQRGDTVQAQEQLETAVALSGGDADLLVRLGQLHLSQNNVVEAQQCAERAIATGTQLSQAWYLKGEALSRSGQLDAALYSYLRAASYDATDLNIQIAVAEVYRKQGRPNRALSTLQALRERCPAQQEPQEMLYLEGLALEALQRHTEAVEVLTLAASREPNPEVLFRLGEAALLAGDPTTAAQSAQAALAIAPNHQGARRVLECCRGGQSRVAAAVDPSGAVPQ